MQDTSGQQKMMDEDRKSNDEGSDLSFEDSQEDEFEVEDVVQKADSDNEDSEDWEDCDEKE